MTFTQEILKNKILWLTGFVVYSTTSSEHLIYINMKFECSENLVLYCTVYNETLTILIFWALILTFKSRFPPSIYQLLLFLKG